jgi:BlaI family transcriptional regulator, penicillinase repressor
METLTKTEEKVMQILWNIKKGFVKDVIEKMQEDPAPPYNTISSLIRLLEKKGFVGHTAYGKTYEYYPVISKAAYRKHTFMQYIASYFEGSPDKVVSFMVKEQNLSPDEIRNMLDQLEKGNNS